MSAAKRRSSTITGAPPGAPPSQLLDHDLAAPCWTDDLKAIGLLLAGMLGLAGLFDPDEPIPGMGAMGTPIAWSITDAQERREAMKRNGGEVY